MHKHSIAEEKGSRLGRKPTKKQIEAACEKLRRLGPDDQKAVLWLIGKMVEGDEIDEL
ncbi:hypothetical protein GXW78_18980 [Roseomonas terrae]|uniref:Uncharacterized protein n=1 Tax=Neoroseomonas terrae TaxID=424799 RepID=A0ABS5EL52_9PROT|nr:hypothetical protein [Neoroseomonas terrae]MBR0651761.1 hypothetical protein [Neoroseomonas terrae]